MKISVIIPAKNRASLLPFTLKNILSQTLKPHEIIVVDDGSTDNIIDVVHEFQTEVIFVNNQGKGPGAARNTGYKIATGNLIQFFDSDDLMTLNKLETQAMLLTKHDADFVYGPWVKAYDNNGVWNQLDGIMQYHPIPKGRLANFVLEGWCNITQSVLFKKELIEKAGLWREDLMPHEDYEFWFRIGKVANNFIHENDSCVLYRQHGNQITNKDVTTEAKWIDNLNAMRIIANGINFKPSLKSSILFKGKYTMTVSKYKKKFNKITSNKIDFSSRLSMYTYRLFNKIGRIRTGNSWQKINGVLTPGNLEFKRYIGNIH